MLRFSKKPTEEMPFKVFYVCKDEEDLASLSAGFDLLLELSFQVYKEDINKEEVPIDAEYEDSQYLVIPLQATKQGKLRYVSHIPSKKLKCGTSYFWSYKEYPWMLSRGPYKGRSSNEFRVYRGSLNLLVKGERKGSPCSLCPKMLEAMQAEPDCTFGIARCLEELDLRKVLNEAS